VCSAYQLQQVAAICTWPAEVNPMKNRQIANRSVIWHLRLLHPDVGVAADEDTAGEKRWHVYDDLLRACEPHDHKVQLLITYVNRVRKHSSTHQKERRKHCTSMTRHGAFTNRRAAFKAMGGPVSREVCMRTNGGGATLRTWREHEAHCQDVTVKHASQHPKTIEQLDNVTARTMAHVFCSPQRRAAPPRTRRYRGLTQRSAHATNVKGKHCVVQILAAAANLAHVACRCLSRAKKTQCNANLQRRHFQERHTENACEGLERWPTPDSAYHTYTTLFPSALAPLGAAPHSTHQVHTPTAMFSHRVHQLLQSGEGIRLLLKLQQKLHTFTLGWCVKKSSGCVLEGRVRSVCWSSVSPCGSH